MGTLAEIRTGLKNRLATITDLNTYDKAPGTVTVPAAFPIPGTIEFDETMSSNDTLNTFRIRLLVQEGTVVYAQEDLDPYLAATGSLSVRAAINGDDTLGGVAYWTRVSRVARYGTIEHNNMPYLGAEFDVEVNSDGS